MNRFIEVFIAPIAISHELCHYVAAHLLGIRAELHLTRVTHYAQNNAQRIIIELAPALFGFVVMALLTLTKWWMWGIAFNIAWQGGCRQDYYQVWRVLTGKVE